MHPTLQAGSHLHRRRMPVCRRMCSQPRWRAIARTVPLDIETVLQQSNKQGSLAKLLAFRMRKGNARLVHVPPQNRTLTTAVRPCSGPAEDPATFTSPM